MEERLRILLCEDDENLGMLLREYLQAKGFNADLFADGESGYKAFLKGKYDLCVLDVMMPKKDGFALAQEIRTVNSEVPIIFLTAKSIKEDILEGFKIGADDYITKPFSMEELVFRSLFLRAVRCVCGPKATIVATAVVFAALHGLPIGIEGDPAAELVAASLTLKFLEALAFGIVLAAMLFRGGTLPLVIALHAVFDIIYFAGPVLIGGDFPASYVVTAPAGFVSLAAATLILAIHAACALRFPESSFSLGFPEPH